MRPAGKGQPLRARVYISRGFSITLVTILKGLTHVGLNLSLREQLPAGDSHRVGHCGLVPLPFVGKSTDPKEEKSTIFATVERVFAS